jgi:hypothetical protein
MMMITGSAALELEARRRFFDDELARFFELFFPFVFFHFARPARIFANAARCFADRFFFIGLSP